MTAKCSVKVADVLNTKTDLTLIPVVSGDLAKNKTVAAVAKALGLNLVDLFKKEKFEGKADQVKTLHTHGKLPAVYVSFIGLGEKAKLSAESLRKTAATIYAVISSLKVENAIVDAPEASKDFGVSDIAQALVEGFLLRSYQFSRYKKPDPSVFKELTIAVADKRELAAAQKGADHAELLAEGTCLTRDLVNTPAADMTPKDLAEIAKKSKGVTVKVHDLKAIKALKMGSFLSVGLGSTANPPYFIEMHYKPAKKAKKSIAIIGKGVTFDTGGYSIKPAKGMENMKDDMSGAAAVIGFMSIVSRLKPDVAVSGYIAATENMVDGFAQRPGDVCTAMNGKTIEVLNTDAEGRLTLADAITYALKNKPDYIVDMATLTGACLVALGMNVSAILGTDQKLINDLIAAGTETGEALWQLPLVDDYRDELKSPIADLKNIGGGYAGTITAALFLEEFTEKAKWAHIDIAGPAFSEKPLPYTPRGGTGVMVRTLAQWILGL